MIISGALDQNDLDELMLDHEKLARSYRDSMTLRAAIVARLLLGTNLPHDDPNGGIDLSSIAACEPIGL